MNTIAAPKMDWGAEDIGREFHTFKQKCELTFAVPMKDTSPSDRLTYVLLWVGDKGLDLQNTWTEEHKTLEKFWPILPPRTLQPSKCYTKRR